jgi:hypothetical protein
MRWTLVPLLVLHGFIHLLGVPLAWGGSVVGMAGAPGIPLGDVALRVAGVAWLLASLGMLGAALGVALGRVWWRTVAIVAVAVSQVLIVLWWPDARAGTLANILVLAVLIWRPGLAVWRAAPTSGRERARAKGAS